MSTAPLLRALIIEDEPLAARRLTELLRRQQPAVEVISTAESVAAAKVLLDTLRPAPDVLFLDIHLADGLSFELFEQTTVPCPVIFTTAYDQYAIRAFKVNSVDYLLKPIDAGELETAVQKLRERRGSTQAATPTAFDPALLAQVLQQMQTRPSYKEQFVVRVGEHLKTIATEQIAYFFSLEKATLLQTRENRRFVVDYTLEQLESLLDPRQFFRLNRTYLAQASAIQDIIHYTNSRLQTVLQHCPEGPVLVSRERVPAFKAWLDR